MGGVKGGRPIYGEELGPEEEPILVIRYARWRQLVTLLVFALPLSLLIGPLFTSIKNQHIAGIIGSGVFAIAIAWLFVQESLFKSIEFYEDRVIQNWHWIGKREIKYDRARACRPPSWARWHNSFCNIHERNASGKLVNRFKSIRYTEFFLRKNDRKQLNVLLDYATQRRSSDWASDFRKKRISREELAVLFCNRRVRSLATN